MIYGIDFGNCYSHVYALDANGTGHVLNNMEDGGIRFFSDVFIGEDGSIVTGPDAQDLGRESPERHIRFAKRGLFSLEKAAYPIDGAYWTPKQIVTKLFEKIKAEIAAVTADDTPQVSLSFPATCGPLEKHRLHDAARAAGVHVAHMVSEPLAAAYAALNGAEPTKGKVLIFDLGGVSLNLAVVELVIRTDSDGKPRQEIRVMDVGGDYHLGGWAWNERIYTHFLNAVCDESGLFPEEAADLAGNEIMAKTETIKRKLNTADRASMTVEIDGMRIRTQLTKADFRAMTADLVDRVMMHVDHLLWKLNGPQIDRVYVIGGGSRQSDAFEALRNRFPEKVCLMPQYVLAEGAAIAAALCGC